MLKNEKERLQRCVDTAREHAIEIARRLDPQYHQDAFNFKMVHQLLLDASLKMHAAMEIAGMIERGALKEGDYYANPETTGKA